MVVWEFFRQQYVHDFRQIGWTCIYVYIVHVLQYCIWIHLDWNTIEHHQTMVYYVQTDVCFLYLCSCLIDLNVWYNSFVQIACARIHCVARAMFAYCNSTVSIFLPTDHTQTPKVCLYTHVQVHLSFYHPFLSMSLFCIYKNIQSMQHSDTELVCKGSSPSLPKSSRPSLGNKSKTIWRHCKL